MSMVAKDSEGITRGGKPVSVILPIKEYQALLGPLEDAGDIVFLKKAKSLSLSFCPFVDYFAEGVEDGSAKFTSASVEVYNAA